jgi:hypothetical protein
MSDRREERSATILVAVSKAEEQLVSARSALER